MSPAPTGWGVPQPGDRSARDTHTYADLHASDIEEGEQTVHNPWPMAAGEAAVSDGDKLVPTDIATQAELDAHAADADAHHDEAHGHPATAITYDNSASGLTATQVQAAIDELLTILGAHAASHGEGGGDELVFVRDTEPPTPFAGMLWIDTSA